MHGAGESPTKGIEMAKYGKSAAKTIRSAMRRKRGAKVPAKSR
jgi:hypothetical protein